MRFIRWVLFIPFSAVAAVLLGMLLKQVFHGAYFSRSNLWIAAAGLAPLFFARFLPIASFVVLGAVIAPKRGRVQIALLGVLGGIFGWPLGPQYSLTSDGFVFYVTEGIATIAGAAVGMLVAFRLFRSSMISNKDESEPHETRRRGHV